ncbi:hypothetical protein PHLCEN_2v6393 [Hermanssonia centrifuga]|uniref:SPX domain-containing protein n=1 Tax=Hermanssonia centrifuga TaxID=98765 RepID=A0A2R6NZI3_9APHY|nr:hypothetical protein PHLCEN_2v6393 [Hermanssonia centrifuga]
MHFSKTYAQLLLSLPPELRDNAIEYRKLKKLINQVVLELTSLGLSPDFLHQALLDTQTANSSSKGKAREGSSSTWVEIRSSQDRKGLPKVVYEINTDSDRLEPRLRLLVNTSEVQSIPAIASLHVLSTPGTAVPSASIIDVEADSPPEPPDSPGLPSSSLVGAGQLAEGDVTGQLASALVDSQPSSEADTQEFIIPLASDTAFFHVLVQALRTLSTHLGTVHEEFMTNLVDLSRSISSSARPMSSTSTFHPYSHSSNPASVSVHTSSIVPLMASKTDLYSWREIFQLYVDTEVFENQSERSRGERSLEDAEGRLELFKRRIADRGFVDGRALKLKESRQALKTFLQLNAFVLDLKKFHFATTEATRKILKKHAKRTALPVSPSVWSRCKSGGTTIVLCVGPLLFYPLIDVRTVQSLSWAHINHRYHRLANVDWALLNFMKDWFPIEAKKKLHQNEEEAAQEQLQELGINPQGCIIA